jgi:hypothetical protein
VTKKEIEDLILGDPLYDTNNPRIIRAYPVLLRGEKISAFVVYNDLSKKWSFRKGSKQLLEFPPSAPRVGVDDKDEALSELKRDLLKHELDAGER